MLGINANMISTLSAMTAVGSLVFSINNLNPNIFLIGIWIHIFLDSIDGPLARYQNKSSSLGSFIDVICDHIGILTSGFFMLNFTNIDPSQILFFIILYTADIYNIFIVNYVGRPITFAFRPRMLVYLALVLELVFFQSHTSNLLLVLNCILLIQTTFTFSNIVKYLKN